MNHLLVQAIKKAGQIRTKLNMDMFCPINIFDVCAELGVDVRFIDVNMEGMYINHENAKHQVILLSSLRPLPRRIYTCAHELGHHLFGHGSRVDGLNEEGVTNSVYDNDEFLVDSFAGALLMPVAGIELEFLKRNWSLPTSTPTQFHTIASVFGTGYSTLITHCKANKFITEQKARELLKMTPSKILQSLTNISIVNSHFKIIDEHNDSTVIDLEVGNYIISLPNTVFNAYDYELISESTERIILRVNRPGIHQLCVAKSGKSYFVRVQNAGFIGLAAHRHLENQID